MPARERRYILRSLFSPGSHKFWRLKSDCARLVYLALLVHADDKGVVECDHQAVMSMTPRSQWTARERSAAVQALVKSGLGATYRQDSKLYMKINGFEQSQSGQVVSWKHDENPAPPSNISIHTIHNRMNVRSDRNESFLDSQNSDRAFSTAKKAFHRIVGRKSFGSLGQQRHQWDSLISKEGEKVVVSAVELWAREKKESLLNSKYIPFLTFLKFGSEFIELAKQPEVTDGATDSETETMPTVEDNRPPDWEEQQKKIRQEREKAAQS